MRDVQPLEPEIRSDTTTQDSNTATHLFAYTVEEYDAANGEKARIWTRIGAAFRHKDDAGFNIQLRALPLDGRIVLLPPDPVNADNERSNKTR